MYTRLRSPGQWRPSGPCASQQGENDEKQRAGACAPDLDAAPLKLTYIISYT